MKGVILGLAPGSRVIDLTHEIPPGDIRAGAFALAASYAFFPRHTIHVAVVDPGVGSQRPAIAIRTLNYIFVGPDNGLLSWAINNESIKSIHALESQTYFLSQVSSTFHGRDVFAPVAAHLSQGLPFRNLGPRLNDFVRLDWPDARRTSRGIEGEILYIDRFGNAITNISAMQLKPAESMIFLGRKRICSLARCYQAVATGRPVGVIGSSGYLEVAINGGNAAQKLGLRAGMKVQAREPQRKSGSNRVD